ncbi:MAG: phosphonate ABC transporter, permease protein PhnE [Calothrix sp. SM1_5_4]|nr:phosphonate ABC transporter, permease protein PhnE [Calothrix sp. SM1_5_4]
MLAAPGSFSQEYFLAQYPIVISATTLVFILFLAGAAIAHNKGLQTIGEVIFPTHERALTQAAAPPFLRTFWGLHLSFASILTLLISISVTEASLTELLDQDGLQGAFRLWSGLTQPNMSLLPKALAEAIETVFIAFLATIIAIPIAFIMAFFCAKNLMTGPIQVVVYSLLRLGLNVSRSVEPLIWALIFTVWVGVGPFAGMLALMIHSVASLAKYYSEILESVSQGPIDGIRSTGANEVQVVWYGVLPQVVLPYIAMTVYRWDTNVRMATIIGLVGGGGIGTLLIQYQGQAMWPEVGCIILVIAAVVWLMDAASAHIREALK